ncbi:lyase family protein, partial [Vibrio sp. FNV 38]|nr:lyase family protein [Vibrio sp. FNV 38]
MATKLWDKGFDPDNYIEEFTVGNDKELDLEIAEQDVTGSMAHITMLSENGLLAKNEYQILIQGLKEIKEEILKGNFKIEDDIEDVHSQIELMLTRRFGESGKRIHSGRSRNDQVLTDLKLFTKKHLKVIT